MQQVPPQAPYGRPSYGQPPYGQPPYGQTPYGQNPYGPPGYPQQGPGWPPAGPGGPKKSRGPLIAVLVVVVVLLLAGGVAAVIFPDRDTGLSRAVRPSSTAQPRSDQTSDETRIRSVIEAYGAAFTTDGGDRVKALFCAQDADKVGASVATSAGSTGVTAVVSNVRRTGDTAQASVAFGGTENIEVVLLKEQGTWKLCPSGR